MKRRDFLIDAGVLATGFVTASATPDAGSRDATGNGLNILLFTADDLGPDGVGIGCFGGKVTDVSPNLDRFSKQAMRLERAHVTVAICVPSRGALATGRYGHNSGVYGFFKTAKPIPTVMENLREAGYRTGILGKVSHSTPKVSYKWDMSLDYGDLGAGRSPTLYYEATVKFLGECKKADKPFYFMVNSHDPHRPFHDPDGRKMRNAEEPSKLYTSDEVYVPGYLPDLPDVRRELSYYYNSVRRLDDTFGKVMQALDESGLADRTLVMFLSDNGIAVPFSKCNCYLASTHTPWMVRWPGVVAAGSMDKTHFVSGIDFFPTVLAAAGLPVPDGLDGRSFLPLLRSESQDGRDAVFTQIDYKAGGGPVPMRCIQDAKYGYIFNGWSDGETRYSNNNEGITMKAMEAAAKTDPGIAERVRMYRFRDTEEFYDLADDPDCLTNLANNADHAEVMAGYAKRLREWMVRSRDPILATFDKRRDAAEMAAERSESYLKKPVRKPSQKKADSQRKQKK